MNNVKFKGNPVDLKDDELFAVGVEAPDVTFVTAGLEEKSLYDIPGKKVLIIVPSLDTGVCATETRKFNEKLSGIDGVTGIVISADLPFAMKRFCETEGIKNVIAGSDFRYHDTADEFGLEMISGPLKGLLARAVYVVDESNKIIYAELVPEITQEPDYESVLAVL